VDTAPHWTQLQGEVTALPKPTSWWGGGCLPALQEP